MGIGGTLRWALAKLIMRAAGHLSKTVCGNIQLCAGLKAVIEGSTHAIGKWRMERSREIQRDQEAQTSDEKEVLGNIIIETAGTEEEVTEGLEAALGMEIEEVGTFMVKDRKGLKVIIGHWEP